MSIAVACPECNARLSAPETAAGRTVTCRKCHTPIRVPAPAGGEHDEDDRPRHAGRKHLVNIGVLVAVLLVGGGGFAAFWFVFGDKEKPLRPAPPGEPEFTKWSQIGDVKVRVKRALLRAPVTVGPDGGDVRIAPMELSIWVEVENASADKVLFHRPWTGEKLKGDTRPDVEAEDDKGNPCVLVSDPGRDVKDNDPAAPDEMNPGDPPILFCYRFERPDGKAKELRLSVRAPVKNPPPGRHEFRIAAAEWKR